MYYCYILKSLKNKHLYIGSTHDLKARLKSHCQVENKIVHFLEKVENKIVHNIVKKILKIALHRSILLKADATSNGSFLPSFFLNRTEKSGFSVTVENLVSSSV